MKIQRKSTFETPGIECKAWQKLQIALWGGLTPKACLWFEFGPLML